MKWFSLLVIILMLSSVGFGDEIDASTIKLFGAGSVSGSEDATSSTVQLQIGDTEVGFNPSGNIDRVYFANYDVAEKSNTATYYYLNSNNELVQLGSEKPIEGTKIEHKGNYVAITKPDGTNKFLNVDGNDPKSITSADTSYKTTSSGNIIQVVGDLSTPFAVLNTNSLPDDADIRISEDKTTLQYVNSEGDLVDISNRLFEDRNGATYTFEDPIETNNIIIKDSSNKIVGATIDGNAYKIDSAKNTLSFNGGIPYQIQKDLTLDTADKLSTLSKQIPAFSTALSNAIGNARYQDDAVPEITSDNGQLILKYEGTTTANGGTYDITSSEDGTVTSIYTNDEGSYETITEADGSSTYIIKDPAGAETSNIKRTLNGEVLTETITTGGNSLTLTNGFANTLQTTTHGEVGVYISGGQKFQVLSKSSFYSEGQTFYVTSSGTLVGEIDPKTGTRKEVSLSAEERNRLKTQISAAEQDAKDLLADGTIQEEYAEKLRQKYLEDVQKREERFGIDNTLGRTADKVFGFMNAVQSSYGVSALFIGQEELDRRFAEAQESLSSLYLGEIIESAMCDDIRESPLVQDGGIGFIETLGGQDKIAVSIQGKVQEVVTFTNGSEYLYKITYIIKNDILHDEPYSEDWNYNVELSGDKTVNLWTANKVVPPENQEVYTKNAAIVFYSENKYDRLCVTFDPEPAAMQTDTVCNTFVMEESAPSAFDLPQSSAGSSSGGSSNPVLNTGEL